ncbi:MAG: response regulator [Woeseiaceae bacterium]
MSAIEQNVTVKCAPAGLRVLIVEDEDAARVATHRYLENCGHEVAAAGSAGEALEKADALHPDVLVCDWKLTGKRDGIEVARILQKEYGVAIIFVTAYALNDLRRNIGDLGSVGCLRKPISLHTLATVVDSVNTAHH